MTQAEEDEQRAQECVVLLTDALLSLFAPFRKAGEIPVPAEGEMREVIARVFTPAFRNQVKQLRVAGREEMRQQVLQHLGEIVDALARRLVR